MGGISANTRGALLMMGSMAGFTLNDTLVKIVGTNLPLMQIIALRGVMATLLIFALAWMTGALRLTASRQDWSWVGLRSLTEIGATYCFLSALMQMPIANVTAILQVLPLTVTLGSALFFREAVGWRRMGAIAVGFCGMLLIVRPGTEGFSPYTVYALAAVGFVTARDLVTRKISSAVPSLLVTLATSVAVTGFAFLAAGGEVWAKPAAHEMALLAGAAVLILCGYLCAVAVMRVGDVSSIAPFRYTGLVWALVAGYVVFGDWPDGMTLVGAAVVVITGIYTLYREARLRRKIARTASASTL